MSVYATGTSGTIGKYLADKTSALSVNLSEENLNLDARMQGDANAIIHLAGIVGPSNVLRNVEYSNLVNVIGTKRIAEHFLQKTSAKFVFVSTSHVYAKSIHPLTEIARVAPVNIYAAQKHETELALLEMFQSYPERLCIARVFSVLDWDAAPFTLGGGIRRLIEDSQSTLQATDDIRDFLTPSTIADILFEISKRSDIHGIINVCSGMGISVNEAVSQMLKGSGIEIPYSRILPGFSDNPVVLGDNSKLKSYFPNQVIAWKPSVFK